MKKCKICGEIKPLKEFDKNKRWYRGKCKECRRKDERTGKPNLGRFKKGQKPVNGFKKETIPPFKGRKLPKEVREKISLKLKGRKLSPETIEKYRIVQNIRWKNTPRKHGRNSVKHREWCKKVIERDGNKCIRCNKTKKLHAHHLVSWEKSEELRFELSNGITLCPSCHSKEEWKNRERTSWNKGKKLTEEHKEKLKGPRPHVIPWNKKVKKGENYDSKFS